VVVLVGKMEYLHSCGKKLKKNSEHMNVLFVLLVPLNNLSSEKNYHL
jgi:hypothetical protein